MPIRAISPSITPPTARLLLPITVMPMTQQGSSGAALGASPRTRNGRRCSMKPSTTGFGRWITWVAERRRARDPQGRHRPLLWQQYLPSCGRLPIRSRSPLCGHLRLLLVFLPRPRRGQLGLREERVRRLGLSGPLLRHPLLRPIPSSLVGIRYRPG